MQDVFILQWAYRDTKSNQPTPHIAATEHPEKWHDVPEIANVLLCLKPVAHLRFEHLAQPYYLRVDDFLQQMKSPEIGAEQPV